MVNSGLGIFIFLSSVMTMYSAGASTSLSRNSDIWAPFRAVMTNAFQIGKFLRVSFSAMGYRVGMLDELELAEAIEVF
jgi:hypothetical protein